MPKHVARSRAPFGWGGHTVEHYVGLDVSLELTSVCAVDCKGDVVREAKVASEPEVLSASHQGSKGTVRLMIFIKLRRS
jgi:hypothetical protein